MDRSPDYLLCMYMQCPARCSSGCTYLLLRPVCVAAYERIDWLQGKVCMTSGAVTRCFVVDSSFGGQEWVRTNKILRPCASVSGCCETESSPLLGNGLLELLCACALRAAQRGSKGGRVDSQQRHGQQLALGG